MRFAGMAVILGGVVIIVLPERWKIALKSGSDDA